MKVNIFGSCYTRELFNYQDKYDVGCYVMQQSIFTMYAKPLKISLDQARDADGSNFKKRMMYYEFNKIGLKKILECPADFLIIDFADCRYDIYNFKYPEGVKIIYTHDARATFDNIKDDDKFKNIEKEYCNVEENYDEEKIREILTKFSNQILQVYKPSQIILNKIQMSNIYFQNGKEEELINNFHYGKRFFIKKIEDIFLDINPKCKILITEDTPILNINHRFGGPHPMHFEDIYYKYRMELLACMLNNENNSQVIKKYKDKYKNEIKNIKNKTKNENINLKSTERID